MNVIYKINKYVDIIIISKYIHKTNFNIIKINKNL